MYTGMYYAHLLVLLKCKNKADVYKIPYKFRYAKSILKPEHLAWFYAQLQKEDKENEEIKKNTGSVDPLYERQQHELMPYFRQYNVKNVKELLMAMYEKLSSYTPSPTPGTAQKMTDHTQTDLGISGQSEL
jgi:hypothetical protein